MKNILHIISSPNGDSSYSLKLGNAIVNQLQTAYPESRVTATDISENPFPHLDAAMVKAIRTADADKTLEDIALLQRSDAAVKDLLEADAIVISVPLLNFGIPSSLKAWLDHIVRAGLTFSYGENGPIGLVSGKKVYIALASGGVYSQGPMQAYDHAVPYLTNVLNFLGMSDISVIRAEGTRMPALQETALEKAMAEIVL